MRRSVFPVIALVLAACGGDNTLFQTQAPSTTAPAETTVTTATATTTTVTAPPSTEATTVGSVSLPEPDLFPLQALVRIDGAEPVGTLEATVCNAGHAISGAYLVTIAANGMEAYFEGSGIPGRECIDAFDPTTTLEQFGVAPGSDVVVDVSIETESDMDRVSNGAQWTLPVDRVGPVPHGEDQMHLYQDCVGGGEPHDACWGYIPRLPIGEPHEVMKANEDMIAIVPAEYEPLASMTVAIMEGCFDALEGYYGFPLYADFKPVPWRFVVDEDFSLIAAHYTGMMLTTDSQYFTDAMTGEFDHFQWENVLDGKCQEAHETSHMMVAETPLPGWLDEGLAVYASNKDRTNWYSENSYRCEEAGFVEINPWMDTEEFFPFVDLEGGWVGDEELRGGFYTTGACFWDWFEIEFGHEAFQEVLQALAADRRVDYYWSSDLCEEFLPYYVEPVIGEDISAITEDRWGFGNTYDCFSP